MQAAAKRAEEQEKKAGEKEQKAAANAAKKQQEADAIAAALAVGAELGPGSKKRKAANAHGGQCDGSSSKIMMVRLWPTLSRDSLHTMGSVSL